MNLLISSNYNISEEKWSIVIKYNDNVKAITLERLTRIKHFPNGVFYWQKNYFKIFINWLKKLLIWISIKNLDEIFIINFPFNINFLFKNKNINYYDFNEHHLLHAYSAFWWSGFWDSAVLIIDWAWYDEKINKELCYSIWEFKNWTSKNLYAWKIKKNKYKLWVWYMYALHTLLFKMWEWSIMWLSSYWDCKKYDDINLFWKDFLLKDKYVEIFKKYKNSWWDLNDLKEVIKEIYWIKNTDFKTEDIIKTDFKNIAARLQYCTENTILKLALKAKKLSKNKNLCIAWWVWLNIIANSLIKEKWIFSNMFVEPACDDSGLSLWWIYYLENIILKNKIKELKTYWIWKEYSDVEVKKALNKYKWLLKYELNNDIYNKTSKILSNNKIIWWFQWWSELWPRALGFRSILARPNSIKIRNKINKIKDREYWRPLAPVVLDNELIKYFNTDFISPFMLFNSKVKKNKVPKMLWITHSDWTARYQTVNKDNNIYLYKLLKEFNKDNNIPILINTSFNNAWEPIVESPKDAIEMFLSTDLDYLVIWNYIVKKDKIIDKYKFNINKSYFEFFKNNIIVFEKIWDLVLKWLKINHKIKQKTWVVEYIFKTGSIEISFVENNVIWKRKNILLNFKWNFKKENKNVIINNTKINKNKIYKLLSIYYKDFINNKDTKIIISENNFTL